MHEKSYIRQIANQIREKAGKSTHPEKGLDELFDTYAVLALSKGTRVTDEDVHDAWSAWATRYDPANSYLVPYDELSEKAQREDSRFVEAIRSVAASL